MQTQGDADLARRVLVDEGRDAVDDLVAHPLLEIGTLPERREVAHVAEPLPIRREGLVDLLEHQTAREHGVDHEPRIHDHLVEPVPLDLGQDLIHASALHPSRFPVWHTGSHTARAPVAFHTEHRTSVPPVGSVARDDVSVHRAGGLRHIGALLARAVGALPGDDEVDALGDEVVVFAQM